jgi:DNA replication and repair protein RecF
LITQLKFERIAARGLRNLGPTDLGFSPALNVFVGGNGQGKTSLLEGLCVAATGRSFRTDQIREVIQNGAAGLSVSAKVNDDGICREQSVTIGANGRQVLIDGKRVASMASYATHTPIVVFFPNDLDLVTGSAATRRSLLDRIALYSNPISQECRLAYTRALRHRQRLLEKSHDDAKALHAFEAIVAEQGLRYAQAHAEAAQNVCQQLPEIFDVLCGHSLSLDVKFAGVELTDTDSYRQELVRQRASDRQRKRPSFGPHRDDLQLSLCGRSARHHASQGQQRLLSLAIKLAELKCIELARQAHPILLLDDVVSELDLPRTTSVFEWLRDTHSQVFLSTPRDDVVSALAMTKKDQRNFSVADGEIQPNSGL